MYIEMTQKFGKKITQELDVTIEKCTIFQWTKPYFVYDGIAFYIRKVVNTLLVL